MMECNESKITSTFSDIEVLKSNTATMITKNKKKDAKNIRLKV